MTCGLEPYHVGVKLRGFERRCLIAVADTILPRDPEGRFPLGGADAPVVALADDMLARGPTELGLGLRLALLAVLLAPLLVLGRVRTFVGLDRAQRLELLRRLRASRFYAVREIPVLLKSLVCLAWAGLPEVQRAIGIGIEPGEPAPEWADGRRAP